MIKSLVALPADGFGLILPKSVRLKLWQTVSASTEAYLKSVDSLPVAPGDPGQELQGLLNAYDFKTPRDPEAVVAATADLLSRFLLHTSHPVYFGVFNPASATMGIVADALAAAFNPQLASTASGRVCIEIENLLLRYFGEKFGYPREVVHGTFTSGGTAANHTALLCALSAKLPGFGAEGLGSARPVIYVSKETHHSILRAARLCGLGTSAVVELPVDADLRLGVAELKDRISRDRREGKRPLFLVATMGTTSSGAFDDAAALADVAAREDLWLHADAAWGGAAILLPEHRGLFAGVERADSITLDAHKWLSVPMGAGMFFTRHPRVLEAAFQVDPSPYMPPGTHQSAETEPYKQSMEWSRRFIGLKLFMTLAVHGEGGYQDVLRHQVAMGDYLRGRLLASSWRVVNRTSLPVVCFVDEKHSDWEVELFARKVAETGKAWITTTKLQHTGQSVLRAGIANFMTQKEHIDTLVETLDRVRADLSR